MVLSGEPLVDAWQGFFRAQTDRPGPGIEFLRAAKSLLEQMEERRIDLVRGTQFLRDLMRLVKTYSTAHRAEGTTAEILGIPSSYRARYLPPIVAIPDDLLALYVAVNNYQLLRDIAAYLQTSPAYSATTAPDLADYFTQIQMERAGLGPMEGETTEGVLLDEFGVPVSPDDLRRIENERPTQPSVGEFVERELAREQPGMFRLPQIAVGHTERLLEVGFLWDNGDSTVRRAMLQEIAARPENARAWVSLPFRRLEPSVRNTLAANYLAVVRAASVATVVPPAPPPPPPSSTAAPEPLPSTSVLFPQPSQERILPWPEKYRPCHLSDIVDETRAINTLRGYVRTGNIRSSIILWGPSGIGKTTAAEAFARDYLAHRDIIPSEGCADLPGEYVVEIRADKLPKDPEQARLVIEGQVSDIAKMGALGISRGTKRIVILDDIDQLTPRLQDRLESLTERYASNVTFIFTTNSPPERLASEAIRTRSDKIEFKRLPSELITQRLRQIAAAEGLEAWPELDAAIGRVLEEADGSLRDAIGGLQREYAEYVGSQP